MGSGEQIPHDGVIIATNSNAIIPAPTSQHKLESLLCLYEVDQTNIPPYQTIADSGNYANNLYAYTDAKTGKTILSVTSLDFSDQSEAEIIEKISSEVKKYTGALKVNYIKHYTINQALPDIQNLKMTLQQEDIQVMDNIFLAGDATMNGSLNAAMESGRLAAKALLEKKLL